MILSLFLSFQDKKVTCYSLLNLAPFYKFSFPSSHSKLQGPVLKDYV
uniref:Uncharacterized protein n=1 Tax=Rhizophora mucronata TaxID=61149 RepID=A0A2P2J2A0_RHIMU